MIIACSSRVIPDCCHTAWPKTDMSICPICSLQYSIVAVRTKHRRRSPAVSPHTPSCMIQLGAMGGNRMLPKSVSVSGIQSIRRVRPQFTRLDTIGLARVSWLPPARLWSHVLRRRLTVLCLPMCLNGIVKVFVALALGGIFSRRPRWSTWQVDASGRLSFSSARLLHSPSCVSPRHVCAFHRSRLLYCIQAFFEADNGLGHRAAPIPQLGRSRPWVLIPLGARVHSRSRISRRRV